VVSDSEIPQDTDTHSDATEPWAGINPVAPRPGEDLAPLIAWLRTGKAADRRLDFPAGTALPDGRLDLCKQDVGPAGAQRILDALPEITPATRPRPFIKHLLLGTDNLGDDGADTVAAAAGPKGLETLYLGCNGITAGGVCRMADNLRTSTQAGRLGVGLGVGAVWLKRNPLGPAGGEAAAALLNAAPGIRTLDLVRTGLNAAAVTTLADALIAAAGTARAFERVYLGGNAVGVQGAQALARLIAAGSVTELHISAADLGDAGADAISEGLTTAPPGVLRCLSVASNGIGPAAAARLVAAAATANVEILDLGRVRAARVMAAQDNRIDEAAATAIGASLAQSPHRLSHLVLADTGMRSREALTLLRTLGPTPIRVILGKGVAGTVKRQFAQLAEGVPHPTTAPDVAAIRSVYRTAPPVPGAS
jgi:hypothetical protein